MSYILVLFIYAGVLANGDSVSLLQVPGFKTEADCRAAANSAAPLVTGSVKEFRFVCLKQP